MFLFVTPKRRMRTKFQRLGQILDRQNPDIVQYTVCYLPERLFACRTRKYFFVGMNIYMPNKIGSPSKFFPTKITIK